MVAAAEKGGAWVDYSWINAGDADAYLKLAYVVKIQREGREYYLGVGLSDRPLAYVQGLSDCSPFFSDSCSEDWALSVAGFRMSTILQARSYAELQQTLGSNHETDSNIISGGSPYGFASVVFNETRLLASAHWKGAYSSTPKWLLDVGLTATAFEREAPQGQEEVLGPAQPEEPQQWLLELKL